MTAKVTDPEHEPQTAPAEGGPEGVLLKAPERVLATLRQDGTRRWIRPRPSAGAWLTRRRAVAYALMAIFVLIPIVHVNGKPLVLLDLRAREFTLFGTTFVPTDTALLMLVLLGVFFSVFLVTALFGRAWCGWACPQTVYMEFLFRPLERLFEGSYGNQMRLDRQGGGWRRKAKNGVFALIACFLAHTFLAYFVGWEQLLTWMRGSPVEHPTAFAVMGAVTAAMVFDFTWFREQTCLVACPYGRLQSALFDRNSLIVGYDRRRGEPRGKLGRKKQRKQLPVVEPAGPPGDCIDCKACVTTCPTGIDIRDGLQMECISCTQCIDACDAMMDKVGRPRGLIRYCSENELAEQPSRRVLRPRVLIYAVALAVVASLFVWRWEGRGGMQLTVLRGINTPYLELPTGEISNQLRLKVRNLDRVTHTYRIEAPELKPDQLVAPIQELTLKPSQQETAILFVKLPPEAFRGGQRPQVLLRVRDDTGEAKELRHYLLGPVR